MNPWELYGTTDVVEQDTSTETSPWLQYQGDNVDTIGHVSAKYESSGDASAIAEDTGGKAYGKYQLSSYTGTLQDFLSATGYGSQIKGKIGSTSFDRQWKELAKDPQFVEAQDNYIKSTHYDPVNNYLKERYGLDLSISPAVRELVFSTATQFGAGGAKKIFDEAFDGKTELDEKGIIDAVTDIKSDVDRWFKSSTPEMRRSVADRFVNEKQDLYNLIQQEPQQQEVQPQQTGAPGRLKSAYIAAKTGFKRAASDISRTIGSNIAGTVSPFGDSKVYDDLMERGRKVEKLYDLLFDSGKDVEEIQRIYEAIPPDELQAYEFYQKFKGKEKDAKESAKKYFDMANDIDKSITEIDKKVADEAQSRLSVKGVTDRLKNGDVAGLSGDVVLSMISQAPNMILSLVPTGNVAREQGSMVKELQDLGIEDDRLAQKYSIIYAIPSGAVEQMSDAILVGPFKVAIKKFGSKNIEKQIVKESTKKFSAKLIAGGIAKFFGKALPEGFEEVIQGDIAGATKIAALAEYAERLKSQGNQEKLDEIVGVIESQAKRTWGNRADEFLGGVLIGIGYGGAGKLANVVVDKVKGKTDTQQQQSTNNITTTDQSVQEQQPTAANEYVERYQNAEDQESKVALRNIIASDEDITDTDRSQLIQQLDQIDQQENINAKETSQEVSTQEGQVQAGEEIQKNDATVQSSYGDTGVLNDQENQQGVRGDQQQGQTPKQEGSQQEASGEAAETSGVIQTQKSDVAIQADEDVDVGGGVRIKKSQIDFLSGLPSNTPTKKYIAEVPNDHVTMSIDGDNFKSVNDVFGHAEGDKVISSVGKMLKKHFPEYFKGREGGEEFFVDFGKIELTDDLINRISEFNKDVAKNVKVGGNQPFTLSIGVGIGKSKDSNGELRLNSDVAGYKAKSNGRNQIAIAKDGNVSYINGEDVGKKQYVIDFIKNQTRSNLDELLKAGEIDAETVAGLSGRFDTSKEPATNEGRGISTAEVEGPNQSAEQKVTLSERQRNFFRKTIAESIPKEQHDSAKDIIASIPDFDTPLEGGDKKTIGSKVAKAIRLASGNEQLAEKIKGKTRVEIAKLMDEAGLANRLQAGEAGATARQQKKDKTKASDVNATDATQSEVDKQITKQRVDEEIDKPTAATYEYVPVEVDKKKERAIRKQGVEKGYKGRRLEKYITDTLVKDPEVKKVKVIKDIAKFAREEQGSNTTSVDNMDIFGMKNGDLISEIDVENENVQTVEDLADEAIRYMRAPKSEDVVSQYVENRNKDGVEVFQAPEGTDKIGRAIASEIDGLYFNGVSEGLRVDGKTIQPEFYFTTEGGKGTTFTAPITSKYSDVLKKYKHKLTQFQKTADSVTGERATESQKDAIKKQLRDRFGLKESEVKIIFTDAIVDKKGRATFLSEKAAADHGGIVEAVALHTVGKDGTHTIFVSNDLTPKQATESLLHEITHAKDTTILGIKDKRLANKIDKAFQSDLESDLVKKIEREYDKDIQAIRDSIQDQDVAEIEVYDFVKREWLAERVREIESSKIDDNGLYIDDKKPILQKIVEAIRDFVRSTLGLKSNDEKVTSAVKEFISKMQDANTSLAMTNVGTQYMRTAQENTSQEVPKKVSKNTQTKDKKPRKKVTTKQRFETYARDRLAYMAADNPKNFKIRYFDFVTKQIYGEGASSVRKQLFDQMEKVKSIGDAEYKKLISMTNEFVDWQKAKYIDSKLQSMAKKLDKVVLPKATAIIKERVIKNISDIREKHNLLTQYQTLKRLIDRGIVARPVDGKTGELRNIGEKYRPLVEAGYIDSEHTVDDSDATYYKITEEGKKYYNELKTDKLIDEKGEMFGVAEMERMYDRLKDSYGELRNSLRENIQDAKKAKDKIAKEAVGEIVSYTSKLKPKQIKSGVTGKTLNLAKGADLHTQNLEFILNSLDDFQEGGVFTRNIFDVLYNGVRETLRFGQEQSDFLKESLKPISKKELMTYSESFANGTLGTLIDKNKIKKTKYELDSGKQITLTPTQRIAIYMTSMNEKGLKHLVEGGIALDHKGEVFKLNPKDIQKIVKDVESNKNEKLISDTYFKYFERQASAENKTSNLDLGYDIATEPNYFPLSVYGDYINKATTDITSIEDVRDRIHTGKPSNLKARQDSSAPIVVEGVFEAAARVSSLAEQYVGMAIPLGKVKRILNSSEYKKAMTEAGLVLENEEINSLIRGLTMVKPKEIGSDLMRLFYNKFAVAALGYRANVALMQTTALLSYYTEKGSSVSISDATRNLAKGFAKGDEVKDLVYKYSPVLRNRYEGFVSREAGETAAAARARNDVAGEDPRLWRRVLSAKGAMSWISAMDRRVIEAIWTAVEYDISKSNPSLKGDALYEAVARKTEDVVRKTQANYMMLDRPAILRTANPIVRALTMFTSESVKKVMLVRRALHDIKTPKHRERGVKNLVNLLVIQPIVVEAIRQGWRFARGKDKEEEKNFLFFFKRYAFNLLGMYPLIGSMATSVLAGYGVNLGGAMQDAVENILSLGKNIAKMANGEGDSDKLIKSIDRAISTVEPLGGVEDMIEVLNTVKDVVNSDLPSIPTLRGSE